MDNSKTCAVKNCRKPSVKGSPYCHYHLSKFARIGAIAGGTLVALGTGVGVLVKIVMGRKV
jgi:hypothetical protein